MPDRCEEETQGLENVLAERSAENKLGMYRPDKTESSTQNNGWFSSPGTRLTIALSSSALMHSKS
jgi:hypothetical protein